MKKQHIKIKDSYNTWLPSQMEDCIISKTAYLSREQRPLLIIEWWLHNIGYWVTKPFIQNPTIKSINLRCKDVDLMVDVPRGAA